jgi:hypothetical protein
MSSEDKYETLEKIGKSILHKGHAALVTLQHNQIARLCTLALD